MYKIYRLAQKKQTLQKTKHKRSPVGRYGKQPSAHPRYGTLLFGKSARGSNAAGLFLCAQTMIPAYLDAVRGKAEYRKRTVLAHGECGTQTLTKQCAEYAGDHQKTAFVGRFVLAT